MAELEVRLAQAVSRRSGFAAEVAGEALAAGGKRLRPLLCFLASPRRSDEPPLAAGVAVELVHMATLVHDDLVDGARMRRGRARRLVGLRRGRRARRRRLSLRVRLRRARRRPATRRRSPCSPTRASCLARGEALQRRQTHDPDTTIEAYLERCALKTGKLFEAACLLGSGGDAGARRVRPRARDRLPDRRRHPRLRRADAGDGEDPRHRPARGDADDAAALAAPQDETVRAALAGGPLDGALVRVAATDALTRSREAALDYASKARSFLGAESHREELEALTYAVVDRAS